MQVIAKVTRRIDRADDREGHPSRHGGAVVDDAKFGSRLFLLMPVSQLIQFPATMSVCFDRHTSIRTAALGFSNTPQFL